MNFVWDDITPEKFEELTYFLLDDLGFKNIEWRKGGIGISSTDGGRDLQAKYTNFGPGDMLSIENWWIEVKSRRKTLSPDTIQKIITNAVGYSGLDVLLIVTNNTVSNKTIDWVHEFQKNFPVPRVLIWQRHDIEKLLWKHPSVAARYFSESLSLQDQLKGVSDSFWNATSFPAIDQVERFWIGRENLAWDEQSVLAIVASESILEGFVVRKWGRILSKDLLLRALILGLVNFPSSFTKFHRSGNRQEPLINALVYLLESILIYENNLEFLTKAILNPHQFVSDSYEPTEEFFKLVIKPLLEEMFFELAENCSIDCQKVSWGRQRIKISTDFFARFADNTQIAQDNKPFVTLQFANSECSIKLVPKGSFCPLVEDIEDKDLSNIEILLQRLKFGREVLFLRGGLNLLENKTSI